jgi:hypothetical protein
VRQMLIEEGHRLPGDLIGPVLCIGVLLMLGLILGFAWSNFRRFGASLRRVIVQLLVLFTAVGLTSLACLVAAHLARLGGR